VKQLINDGYLKETGGLPITNYIIEKLDTKKNEWQRVSSFCKVPFYEVMGLAEDHSYKFRVMAENEQGQSVPLETDVAVIAKNPFDKPNAPSDISVAGQTSNTVTLQWKAPSDGGSKILGYNVEVKEDGSDDWFPVNENLIKGNNFTGKITFSSANHKNLFPNKNKFI